MKPIGARFGFWLMVLSGIGHTLYEQHTPATICLVGAILFNAIHTKGQ